MLLSRKDFPQDFIFGTATSSYQIEGHSFGGAGRTHWDDFADTPGNVVRAENGDIACDHYHRYAEDLDLVANAGFDAYRFSISWARVLPEGRGAVNAEGLDFYDRLVDAMLERGLSPYATLYHWELPSALADLGGWRNRDIAQWFGDFTEVAMKRIGDRVDTVAPINEPWCVAWLSHFLGGQAPGIRDIRAAARAMHHVLLAHGRATEVMRGLGMNGLGGVFNLEWAHPADDSEGARAAAARYDGLYNRWFMGGVFRGESPEIVLEGLEPHLPAELLTALSRVLDDDRRFTISSPESPVLTHSDLHEEHILVDPASGRPSGIIDWSDLSIVDPAVDFVGLRHWRGAAFAEAVLEARGLPLVDPQSFQDRLETMTICVAAIVTDYGLHGDRPDCLTLGRRALERELGLLEPRSDPEPAAG